MFLFSRGFDSETDTEEFEKVCQSPIEKRSTTAITSTNPPETCSIGTSTDTVETISIETLTEVRNNSNNKLSIPKKPPRNAKLNLTLLRNDSIDSNSSLSSTLPSIPEITSPLYHENVCTTQYSDTITTTTLTTTTTTTTSPDNERMIHLNIKSNTRMKNSKSNSSTTLESNSSTQECADDMITLDDEFINSEFYIDESLPSSLDSDKQDEIIQNEKLLMDYLIKIENLKDHNLNTNSCDLEKFNDDTRTVLLLLQVH